MEYREGNDTEEPNEQEKPITGFLVIKMSDGSVGTIIDIDMDRKRPPSIKEVRSMAREVVDSLTDGIIADTVLHLLSAQMRQVMNNQQVVAMNKKLRQK